MLRRIEWYRNKSRTVTQIAPDRKVEFVDIPSFTQENGTLTATGKRYTFTLAGNEGCPNGWALLYSARLGGWYLLRTSTVLRQNKENRS